MSKLREKFELKVQRNRNTEYSCNQGRYLSDDVQALWEAYQDQRDADIERALKNIVQDYSEAASCGVSIQEYVQNAVAQLIDAGYKNA